MSENSQEESEISIDRKEFRKRYKEFMKNNIHHINRMMTLSRERVGSFGTVIEENAEQFADKVAIKFEGKQLTYKEFNELVNKYAHYLLSLGLEKGDIVDIIRFGDDLGMDSGPFMSIDIYRELFHEHRKQMSDYVHKNRKKKDCF